MGLEASLYYDNMAEKLKKHTGRHLMIESFLDSLFLEKSFSTAIDVGCGSGLLTKYLSNNIKEITGIDISEKNIENCKELVEATFICSDFLDFDSGNKQFDLIALFDALEHFERDKLWDVFYKIREIAHFQTTLCITTPDPDYAHFMEKENPEELQLIDEVVDTVELVALAEDFGFSLRSMQRFGVDCENQYIYYLFDRKNIDYVSLLDDNSKLKEAFVGEGDRKIAFFTGSNDHFLIDIMQHISGTSTVYIPNGKDSMQAVFDWADLAWFEWCEQQIKIGSKIEKTCKIINRLHSYELFSTIPKLVNWENVDKLIFVAPHVRDIFNTAFVGSVEPEKQELVANGVNLDKFCFTEKERGFNIACVGAIHEKKNHTLLIHYFNELLKRDNRYSLHIAGSIDDKRAYLSLYNLICKYGLQDRVKFYGNIDNIPQWLEDKHYIISTSLWEGCPLNIVEAMAMGCKPIIFSWIGSDSLYPPDFLFTSSGEFCNLILSDDYSPKDYRLFVERNYSLENQLKRIDRIIDGILI